MKSKNNDRRERGHAVEREEICMLHTFLDYLAFLYTPPLCEVGMQVDRSRVPDARFAGISSANILIGQCTHNYLWIYSYGRIERLNYLFIWLH